MGAIYRVWNTKTNQSYIGLTSKSAESRIKDHLAGKGAGSKVLQRAIKMYGIENFMWETLVSNMPVNMLREMEIDFIEYYDSYRNGYNQTPGGEGNLRSKRKRDKKPGYGDMIQQEKDATTAQSLQDLKR